MFILFYFRLHGYLDNTGYLRYVAMLVIRIGRFKPRLGLFKRFKRLREYPILEPIL